MSSDRIRDNWAISSGEFEVEERFWRDHLADLDAVASFPAANPRRPEPRAPCAVAIRCPDELGRDLVRIAGGSDYGLYILALTAVQYLLYRYSGEPDVVIAVPPFARAAGESVGRELVVRRRVADPDSFAEAAQHNRAVVDAIRRHASFPVSRLLDQLPASRDGLFPQVAVVSEELHDAAKCAAFPIRFVVSAREPGRLGAVTFDPTVCTPALITHVVERLAALLSFGCASPRRAMADFELVTAAEIARYYPRAVAPSDRAPSIVDRFAACCRQFAARTAIVHGGTAITYRELEQRSDAVAAALHERGAGRETIVAVQLDRSPDLIATLLGTLKVGAAYLPVDPAWPEARLVYVLSDSGARFLVTRASLHRTAFEGSVLLVDDIAVGGAAPPVAVDPASLAYVIYTSGTTGQPKGVMIEHRQLTEHLFAPSLPLRLSEHDVWTLFHSQAFDVSVWEYFGALLHGGAVVIVPNETARDPKAFLELLVRERVTVVSQTPTALASLVNAALRGAPRKLAIRYIVLGGERLDPRSLAGFVRCYPEIEIINMYGITEITVHGTHRKVVAADTLADASPIGRALPALCLYVVDAALRLVPPGVPGELCVGGRGVARGYLHRPELTRERFVTAPRISDERLYRSGDRVRMLDSGELEYLGRTDAQLKVRGYRIEPAEIEAALLRVSGVNRALVVGRQRDGATVLCAYLETEQAPSNQELRAALGRWLPDYMIPAHFVALARFPMTANGKLDAAALVDPLAEPARGADGEPADDAEQQLCAILARVLGVPRSSVGTDSEFFAIGGDSIQALRAIALITEEMHAEVPVGEFYTHQSPRALARLIAGMEQRDRLTSLLARGQTMAREFADAVIAEAGARLPAGYQAILPMTQVEKGMIYCSLMRPEEPVYYDQFVDEVELPDPNAFSAALATLVQRHEVLRSRFYRSLLGREARVVMTEVPLPLMVEDLSQLPVAAQEQAIRDARERDAQKRYQFEGDVPWHIYQFVLSHGPHARCVFVLSFHHAVLDGWSVAVLFAELSQQLLGDGREPPSAMAYADYCAFTLGRGQSEAARAFWREYLAGYTRSRLPFNYSGKRIATAGGMRIMLRELDRGLLERIDRLTASARLSPKAVFLAAHVFLLSRLSSDREVVTGVVSHDRPEFAGSDRVLGCFLTTTPLRIAVADHDSPLALARACHDYLNRVRPYELSLAEIAAAIGDPTSAVNPVFDTLFNYQNFHIVDTIAPSLERLAGSPALDTNREMTNTLFDLEVNRTRSALGVKIKYSPAHFHDAEIEYALELYVRALSLLLSDPHGSLTAHGLATGEECDRLIEELNGRPVAFRSERSVHSLFEDQARRAPDRVAVCCGEQAMSYGELNAQANRLARALVRRGVRPGDRVGLISARSFAVVRGMLAILKAGAAYVPIEPDYPVERRRYLLDHSVARLAVVDDAEREAVLGCPVVCADAGAGEADEDLAPVAPDLTAYVIYTSGSTGRPKGVVIEHRAVVNLVDAINDAYQVGPSDRVLCLTSICFDLSVYDIFGLLAAGGTVVLIDREQIQDPRALRAMLAARAITIWNSVPSTFNYFLDSLLESREPFEHAELRLILQSGDWVSAPHARLIRRFFPQAQAIALGGATEATVWSNSFPLDQLGGERTTVPYGRPIRNNTFYILDESLRPTIRGVAGELYIGGAGVARGYASDPAGTARAFLPDPFRGGRMYCTGDAGRLLPDGNIEFLGRRDFQLKIRGFRVEPGEIESQLCSLPGVTDAVVLARTGAAGTYLCAYVGAARAISLAEVQGYLSVRLPSYMVAEQLVVLDRLPLTPNGKIDRKALPVVPLDAAADVKQAPRDAVEQRLQDMVAALLGGAVVGATENLFAAGMHSLEMARLASRISEELDLALPLRELFVRPTIRELAELGAAAPGAPKPAEPPIARVPDASSYALSHAQERLWVLHQLGGEQTLAYTIGAAYRFLGERELDLDRLRGALMQLAQRHEVLRTTFSLDGGSPRQQIHPMLVPDVQDVDLRGSTESEAQLTVRIHRQIATPFDLSIGPLMRLSIFRLCDDERLVVMSTHHLVSDGWSMVLLVRELFAIYSASAAGEVLTLPPLDFQYRDYAEWQRRALADGLLDGARAYWLARLSGELPRLALRTAPRPAVRRYGAGRVHVRLPAELTAALHALARTNDASPYMAMLALVHLLLARSTRQTDILIGTPVSGRDHRFERQAGFYVNTVALRTRVELTQSFGDVLRAVRDTLLDAFDHARYPFDRLVDDLKLPRELDRHPIFDVMVALRDGAIGAVPHAGGELGWRITPVATPVLAAKFDLTFEFSDGETIELDLEYDTDLYDAAAARAMIDRFARLAAAALADVGTPIGRLAIASDDERRLAAARSEVAGYDAGWPAVLPAFARHAAQAPGAACVSVAGRTASYADIDRASGDLAHALAQRGVAVGEPVVLTMDASAATIAGLLGIWKAGGVVVPVTRTQTAERSAVVLGASGSRFMLRAGELIPAAGASGQPRIAPTGVALLSLLFHGDQVTACPVDHAQIASAVAWLSKHHGFEAAAALLFSAGFHDWHPCWEAVLPLVLPLYAGGRLVWCLPDGDDEALFEVSRDAESDALSFAPETIASLLASLQREHGRIASELGQVVARGEVLPPARVEALFRLAVAPWDPAFGPRESLLADTGGRSIGQPIWPARIYVVDDALAPLPPGLPGQIAIGHAHALPSRAPERFVDAPWRDGERLYLTGEYGRWLPDGAIGFVRLHAARPVVSSFHADRVRDTPFTPPSTESERQVVALWGKVLGVAPDTISVLDEFFDVGGNSLRLVTLRAALEENLSVALSIVDLFQHATVSEIAGLIDGRSVPGETATTGVEL